MQPRLESSPLVHPDAVISGDHWRISVLTTGLVRLEWSEDGPFEDRASTLALHRDQPVPDFRVVQSSYTVEIFTDRFHLTYDRQRFSPGGLSLQVRGDISTWHSLWRFGADVDDLGGTARTLDGVDGRVPLEAGVTSWWGFAVLDDSRSFVFDDEGWVAPRVDGGRLDLYVFAYGHDHQAALDAFYALSGRPPVLPRWALGNWWSRYHPYTADSYLALLDRFRAERLPFSVAVVDMDWHRVGDVDQSHGSGWTGYSWNRTLFPDPVQFLADVHHRGYRVTLNVHPADGVRAYEEAYLEMATALGRNPHDGDPISFDVTDPAFLEAYFSILHRRLEDDGVDFWWVDWQQGEHSRIPGFDPLWMLNHFHFLDAGRNGRRPMTFSRYAGPGSHRYPVGFSGDTVISWASLDFQPEFTATATNIGYGWWSHDVGGHMFGARDDELALRWLQLGVFSPILRLHSSNNPFLVKEPWMYGRETEEAMGAALRLRARLVPYLHTMNHLAATHGVALVRPMYYLYPDDRAAYGVPNQFAFGSQLVVAPITSPRDPITQCATVRAWLPPGMWIDAFTGVVYDGDRELDLHRDDASMPVLVRAGGIMPVSGPDQLDAAVNPERLEIVVAPGADGRFDLIEDDGTGAATATIATATTPTIATATTPTIAIATTDTIAIATTPTIATATTPTIAIATTPIVWTQATGTLTIGPTTGAVDALPARRSWTVTVLGGAGDDVATASDFAGTSQTVLDVATGTAVDVVFGADPQPATDDLHGRLFDLLNRAQYGFEAKAAIWRTVTSTRPVATRLAELSALSVPPALLSALTELLTARA